MACDIDIDSVIIYAFRFKPYSPAEYIFDYEFNSIGAFGAAKSFYFLIGSKMANEEEA